jgi:hypothetical protein
MVAAAGSAFAHDHDRWDDNDRGHHYGHRDDNDRGHRSFGKTGYGTELTLFAHLVSPDAPPVCRTEAGYSEPYANDCGAYLVGQVDVAVSQSVDRNGVKTTTIHNLLYTGSDGTMVNCSAGIPVGNTGLVQGKDSITVTLSLATLMTGGMCGGFNPNPNPNPNPGSWGEDCTMSATPQACTGSWPLPNGGTGGVGGVGTGGGNSGTGNSGTMTLTFSVPKKTYSYARGGIETGTHADGTKVNIKYVEYTTGASVTGTVFGKNLSVYRLAPTDNFRAEITTWKGDPAVFGSN